ncbi:hypothetical protein GUITHDRAFT_162801 [Guillardia theta CCMP2712]|uniref:WW domain-containing protein n=1 Tax=Guillardia theta (strain CCMP2712) TaxID=905079 RepID=L1JGD1_GUITC|nr:hypothetical protein GUITHDRAFT_162801 [Guillardia theta CCMP2712]EKX47199.1 hypothetical protein GUITHDRAFT_162801 [Guillardia theta CCMP2712]|eukprot:XP_005834179.1 hypothetical protein GUITHDRAFT_162801 [Guillardia theta CCMP2712]
MAALLGRRSAGMAATAAATIMLALAMMTIVAVMRGPSRRDELKGFSSEEASKDLQSYFHTEAERVKKESTNEVRKVTAKASRASLDSYFKKQSLAIKKRLHPTPPEEEMSAKAAQDDLNKYFDSLPTQSKRVKINQLSDEVKSLAQDVKKIMDPVKALEDHASKEKEAMDSLHKENERMLEESRRQRSEVEDSFKKAISDQCLKQNERTAKMIDMASRAASDAEEASKHSKSTTVVVRQNLAKRTTKYERMKDVNPRVSVEGLPPGWSAYLDRRTKYVYYYNKANRKSTWINPKGSLVHVEGMPSPWQAYKIEVEHLKAGCDGFLTVRQHGKLYYLNPKTGESTWEDPRVRPGRKVLDLIREHDRHRNLGLAEKSAKLSALADDHGVYAHNWPRSQWTDKAWMKFLNPSKEKLSSLTSGQELRQGYVGSEQNQLQPASSSSY